MRPVHILFLLALVSFRILGADGVRVAVLAGEGERAPQAGVVDLLMTALLERPKRGYTRAADYFTASNRLQHDHLLCLQIWKAAP
jgi:hypothetical protein